MINNERYLFWKLAHGFIVELGYRMIKLSSDQNELWLEKEKIDKLK